MFHQLIRVPLRCVPKNVVIPILSGPARGLKWVTGSGTHGCWLGTYERDRQRRMQEVLRPGQCFLDIGANVGFYSLLASRLVGAAGQVHAIEPFPRNVDDLKRHVDLNQLQNVMVYPLALSDGPDRTMSFATSINPSCGHLSDNMTAPHISVGVTSLDALWDQKTFSAPSVIKIDVEGAEFGVLQGGRKMLTECRPIILLAGHGSVVQEECCELLKTWGYRVEMDRDGTIDGMYESTAWPV